MTQNEVVKSWVRALPLGALGNERQMDQRVDELVDVLERCDEYREETEPPVSAQGRTIIWGN